jgi:hypothetical protein
MNLNGAPGDSCQPKRGCHAMLPDARGGVLTLGSKNLGLEQTQKPPIQLHCSGTKVPLSNRIASPKKTRLHGRHCIATYLLALLLACNRRILTNALHAAAREVERKF